MLRISVERDSGGNPVGFVILDRHGIGGVAVGRDRLKRLRVGADRLVEVVFEVDAIDEWQNEALPFEELKAEEAI